MTLTIRPLEFERRNELRVGSAYGFGWDEGSLGSEPDPDFDALYEAERTRCVFDGHEVVGTLAVFSLELSVPGGSLRTAGTTSVTVRPTHRRRGLLRLLMASHFEDVRERREPLSALWASDSGIYRRFGYGVAAEMSSETIDRGRTQLIPLPPVAGSCRMLGAAEALELLPPLYDRVRRQRPGMMARSEAWWRHRVLRDAPYSRQGATPLRRVVHERDGEPCGYLLYRMRSDNDVRSAFVVELVGIDGESARMLYGVATQIDLVDAITLWNQPIESPLSRLLADPRRLKRSLRDTLWLRLMDVEAALAGRVYAADGALRIRVHDAFLPANEGCYELVAQAGKSVCRRVGDGRADVELDVADLGAVYLGGTALRALARVGRARGSHDGLTRADAMFTWDPPPWNPELF